MGSKIRIKLGIMIIEIVLLMYSANYLEDVSGSIANSSIIPSLSNSSSPSLTRQAGLYANDFPMGIVANPSTNKIYVTNEFSNTLSVIDDKQDKLEGRVAVGMLPYGVDVDPFTNRIYVANLGSNSISVIQGGTNEVTLTIQNVSTPVDIDVDALDSYIYITNIDNDTVSKIDIVNNKIVNTIKVGDKPFMADVMRGKEYKLYVTNIGSDTVSVINGTSSTLLKDIAVGDTPVGVAVNPLTNMVYVTNRGSDTVSIIDANMDTIVKNLTVGAEPDGVAINLNTSIIYVSNTGSDTVSVINGSTNEIIKDIQVNGNVNPELSGAQKLPPILEFPNLASFVDVNPVTNMIYVTNPGSNTVSIIDGKTNSMVIGITVNINPSSSGKIYCNGQNIDGYVRVKIGTEVTCEDIVISQILKNYGRTTLI